MTDYRLLCCNESPHNGRVYYAKDAERRWIPSGEHVKAYGFKWELVESVTVAQLAPFRLMPPLPHPTIRYLPATMTLGDMHEYIGKDLTGSGVEFGAASSPFPIAIGSTVRFADFYDHALKSSPYFSNEYYARAEYVTADLLTSMETMDGLKDGSLDFIIACHVIEHLRNPLLAMETAWKKLKPGGKLVLLVPHRDLTFDKNRELTTLEHLILDYEHPNRNRDFLHFLEFYEKAFVTADYAHKAATEFNSAFSDIHYHVWNEDSFLAMMNYFSQGVKPWSSIDYYPHLPNQEANEFYFIMTK